MFHYSMTFYISNDHPEMSSKEALDASQEMMQGHKWQLLCLGLRFLGWNLLGILTLGILNILFVGPWQALATANFYQNLVNENKKETVEESTVEDASFEKATMEETK